MADNSSIEWTDATWNPVRGCTRISAGCGGPNRQGGCYAEQIAARFPGPGQPFEGFAERTTQGGRWTGKMALVDDMLTLPLRWKKPRRIFVNSMSDLFHENLPDEAIDKVFAVMALVPQHTLQVLTKRAKRMRTYLTTDRRFQICGEIDRMFPMRTERSRLARDRIARVTAPGMMAPLENVHLGVSTEDQPRADERIPHLYHTPAAKRFISAEPLLGPIDLMEVIPNPLIWSPVHGITRSLDWVIVGGESGPRARPAHPDWFRTLRDQCAAAGVPFFFKQWGEWVSVSEVEGAGRHHSFEDGATVRRVGKTRAGALLDGCEHRGFPA
ncbi:DUF5131 family protein [Reyranella sp.]|uniref:DUF5131 family protein n=1 Tax=Reyranella sp. TaxID=1929291 RepID=UPI00403656D6